MYKISENISIIWSKGRVYQKAWTQKLKAKYFKVITNIKIFHGFWSSKLRDNIAWLQQKINVYTT